MLNKLGKYLCLLEKCLGVIYCLTTELNASIDSGYYVYFFQNFSHQNLHRLLGWIIILFISTIPNLFSQNQK